jgi:hypothetical protein
MALNEDFIKEYLNLLIIQYQGKPKATGEVTAMAGEFGKVYDFYTSFFDAFDLDLAVGKQLDIIGKIVGPRSVPFILAKYRFGFDGDATAKGMADFFDDLVDSAPMYDYYESAYTDQELDDYDYRFFIKAKISKNIVSAYMVNDSRITIQDVISYVFGDNSYVIDSKEMILYLNIPLEISSEIIKLVRGLELLPRPQGVDYIIIKQDINNTLGFEGDPNAVGFGEYGDPSIGGIMASIVL